MNKVLCNEPSFVEVVGEDRTSPTGGDILNIPPLRQIHIKICLLVITIELTFER